MPHKSFALDNGRKMDFDVDSNGKLKKVKVGGKDHDSEGDIGQLTIDGQPVSWVPDGTVIKTGANSYYYYFFNGRWYRVTV